MQQSEYWDKHDWTRLYNRQRHSKVYVSKRGGDESDFWTGGKFGYDDPVIIIYKIIIIWWYRCFAINCKYFIIIFSRIWFFSINNVPKFDRLLKFWLKII